MKYLVAASFLFTFLRLCANMRDYFGFNIGICNFSQFSRSVVKFLLSTIKNVRCSLFFSGEV